MTAFVLVFSLLYVALIAGLLVAMPAITPRTLPLGVAVPSAHVDDPAVRAAVRRYRIGEGVAAAVAVVLAIALAFIAPVAAAIAPMLVLLVLSVVVYVVTRNGIRRAKAAGAWYQGVPVRLSAEITAPVHHRPPILWPVLAGVLLVVAAGIGIAAYPHLPDPYPTHRALDGRVDATGPKTVLVVFTPLIIGAVIGGVMALLSAVVSRLALRPASGDAPAVGTARAAARRGVLAALMSELSAAIVFGLSLLAVLGWVDPDGGTSRIALVVLVALIVVAIVAAAVRLRRIVRPEASPRPAGGPDAPDDDARWKAGIVYVDRRDPSLFVPKRFGIGWTVNFGHPGGIAIAVVLLLVLVGVVVAAALGIRAR